VDACWYITHRWSVHDDRWVAALTSQGFEVRALSLERDHLTVEQVHEMVAQQPDLPILAGPLTSVTSDLLPVPNRCVGLSWGFDLIEIDKQAKDSSWLTTLDHLIIDSPQTRAIAIEAGMPPEHITEIPWGIDLEHFTPVHTPSSTSTVLSLRALEDLYDVSDLIAAWPDVIAARPSAKLLIGNHGSLRPSLEEQVRELGIESSVRFLGFIPESELPTLLNSVDLYVSTSPIDGTSVTMLQAMACAVPVLVTDTPGNRSWITPGQTGFLYRAGDVQHLSSTINEVLDNQTNQDMSDVTTRARRIVEDRADWQRNIQQLRGILLGD
jgi:glycosyltransferase involved in cell wall biosynthesis